MLPEVDYLGRENKWLIMNIKDSITTSLRNVGEFARLEQEVAKIFLIKENRCLLDVGANLGSFTVPMAKHQDKINGKVYSFEPQRIVFQNLCANIFINRCSNVYPYNIALGEIDDVLTIPELDLMNSDNIGGFSVDSETRESRETKPGFNSRNYYTGTNYYVEQKALDNLKIDQPIGFIKVDIEGYELEFFRGSINILEKNNFPPILFEVWEQIEWYKERAVETKNFLESLGYKLTRLGENYVAQHQAYDIEYEFNISNNNINTNRLK